MLEIGENSRNFNQHEQEILNDIELKIAEWKLKYANELAQFDVENERLYLEENDFCILPTDTYLYIRGHNLLGKNQDGVILALLFAVSDIKRQAKKETEDDINNKNIAWQDKKRLKEELYASIDYKKLAEESYKLCFENEHCTFMQKIKDDVKKYFDKKTMKLSETFF